MAHLNFELSHSPHSLSLQKTLLGGRYTDLKRLGGTNSVVFSALDAPSKHRVAIKRLTAATDQQCRAAIREIRILRHLEHDNIVDLFEILGLVDRERSDRKELLAVYLVLEHCDTDLHFVLKNQTLDSEHVKLFSYQLLKAAKYIHSSNVVHRDIKPSNILINLDKGELKICDFGSARMIDPNYDHSGYLTGGKSTLWYRAPECIITPQQYNKRCDIWSIGCVIAEMILGKPLYPGKYEHEQLILMSEGVCTSNSVFSHETSMIELTRDPGYSEKPIHPLSDRLPGKSYQSALNMLEKMLKFNPGERVTSEQALADPYFDVYSYPDDEPINQCPFQIESYVDDFMSDVKV
ncbi:hypothetical protein ACHWQZ_G009413 [Mnemiopsis leidyi]